MATLQQISFKKHLLIGLMSGLWLTLFLVFVGPFDAADQPLLWRAQVMYGYGVVICASYLVSVPVQNWFGQRGQVFFRELSVYLIVTILSLFGSFWYYKTEIINGDFNFITFVLYIYIPTIIIFLPIIFLTKRLIGKLEKLEVFVPKATMDETDVETNWKPKISELIAQKVHLNPAITLKEMATDLDTNTVVLSKIINQGYGMNFNDFINKHRIAEVVKAMEQGEHHRHTFAGIAQNCGFKSKATFYRAFKKEYAMSPTEYVKQNMVSNNNTGQT